MKVNNNFEWINKIFSYIMRTFKKLTSTYKAYRKKKTIKSAKNKKVKKSRKNYSKRIHNMKGGWGGAIPNISPPIMKGGWSI